MRERIDIVQVCLLYRLQSFYFIFACLAPYIRPNKNMCVSSHTLKNILRQSVWNDLFLTLVFITELMFDGI